MTETVSEFKARVARLRAECPAWREGQAHFNAMAVAEFGPSSDQIQFCEIVLDAAPRGSSCPIDPYHNDANIAAFLAAAVEAGVLREG